MLYPFIFLLFLSNLLHAQNVKLSGKIIDAETATPLVGASVIITNTNKGTVTDVEGKFFLAAEQGKQYSIKVSSVGYQTKEISDVTAAISGSSFEISLEKTTASLEAVIVTSNVRKESSASLYLAQKNNSAISDGISSEVIKKSPDRNTSDVLKRVSGASIQENKFVVIRGLNERYNVALLNNSVLPSTEADKKAFSFNIIPSSVIDNVVIYKSATPDLPGDFSGGAVKITTKDYPSRKLSELSFSTSYNSLTTFKDFYKGFPDGNFDWLGFFDNSRLIPRAYYNKGASFINENADYKHAVTKQFSNTFGYEAAQQSAPNFNLTYTGGNTKLLGGSRKLGYIYSLTYGEGRRVSDRTRDDYQGGDKRFLYENNTTNYDINSNLAALLNVTYSYGKNKISWKNLFNNDFAKTVGIRNGYDASNLDQQSGQGYFYYKSNNSEAMQNGVINSVLEGLHSLNPDFTIDWNASFGATYRWQPDQKILSLRSADNSDANYYLRLSNENSPDIQNAGRVYSFQHEYIYGANVNATKQFQWFGETQKFKAGLTSYYRDRNVEVDGLGYASTNPGGVFINEDKSTTFNNIFSADNIDKYNLTVANIGTNTVAYHGTALLTGGYLMLDNKFSDKAKLTWGARAENYDQKLTSPNKADINNNNFDILPSALFTYSLTRKTNLRFAASQSVNRPEFRELAAYSVYDYDNNFVYTGNDTLSRCKNTNADLRYEWFPSSGEIISVSVFYKYFDKPIEQVNLGNTGSYSIALGYQNADNATTYGTEVEIRKKLDFIGSSTFSHFTFYANAAYIKGSVQLQGQTINSPMQGQSPYLVNGGLSYSTTDNSFSVNVLYNRVGPRLRFRARSAGALDIFEKPRDVMDAQISKQFLNNKLELKLTIGDIFSQAYVWYYKFDTNPKNINYKSSTDKVINSVKYGSTTTLSLRYNFGK